MKKRDKRSGRKERFSIARKLYDSFTVKDMSFSDFERAYNAELSPRKMQRELKELVRYRGHQRTQGLLAAHQKKEIDARLMED